MTGLMQPIDRTDKFVYQIVNILVARYLMRKIKKKKLVWYLLALTLMTYVIYSVKSLCKASFAHFVWGVTVRVKLYSIIF